MEDMVNRLSALAGKTVLVTGHTGFKGSWLAVWLHMLGARVTGVALDPAIARDNYVLTGIGSRIDADLRADVRDRDAMMRVFDGCMPEVVFHLAAQPLVRRSYAEPALTYETNVMGTVNVLEAIRATQSVRAAVMVTSDKCYENREQRRGYVEDDPMGGYDPYSSSKGAAELAIASWRRSFFNPKDYGKSHHVSLASVRAGNVIGGGDWADDRIVPDCIRALEAGQPVGLRNPAAVRPWQHVLEPLGGYLLLAARMLESPTEYCEAWNFGPDTDGVTTVGELAGKVVARYGSGTVADMSDPAAVYEARLLTLDITKAQRRLHWRPRLDIDRAVAMTVDWYRRYRNENVLDLCREQIEQYMSL